MRIIRGSHRGRKIHTPGNLPVRPTTDLAKESLFNIIENHYDLEGLTILDLFAGTGSISYEFASRGAAEVISVDINPRCVNFIRDTATTIGFSEIKTVKTSAFGFLNLCRQKFDIIFADPPYDIEGLDILTRKIFELGLLKDGGIFILEHSAGWSFIDYKEFSEERKYGKVHFSIFRKPAE